MNNQPNEEETRTWHRRFAVECNNRTWRLSEMPDRSPTDDVEMLNSAHAAAFHWGKVGTDLHAARAGMLLGHVHALLGNGELAIHYARSSFTFVTSHDSPDWEIAFAHAILANAASAIGDPEAHARHYAIARALADALTDAEDREIFEATFRVIPVP